MSLKNSPSFLLFVSRFTSGDALLKFNLIASSLPLRPHAYVPRGDHEPTPVRTAVQAHDATDHAHLSKVVFLEFSWW